MQLSYTNVTINSPDGTPCKVLDLKNVDFSSAALGRKSTETLVRRAEGGEHIETKNSDKKVESVYIAKPGDAIFMNLHNPDDIYVPSNPDGSRWQFKELTSKGYEISRDDHENGGVLVKSIKTAKLLREAITEPTCISNAWGQGQHQFLFPGATLKKDDNGNVTGIDKEAFDATWEITSPSALTASNATKLPNPQNG
jgi:hypothetical protein